MSTKISFYFKQHKFYSNLFINFFYFPLNGILRNAEHEQKRTFFETLNIY
jgi:hypothetical protein